MMFDKAFRRFVLAMVCVALVALVALILTRSESLLAEPFTQDLRIDAQDLEIDGQIEVPGSLIIGTGHYAIISPGEYAITDASLNTITMTAPIELWRINTNYLYLDADVETHID